MVIASTSTTIRHKRTNEVMRFHPYPLNNWRRECIAMLNILQEDLKQDKDKKCTKYPSPSYAENCALKNSFVHQVHSRLWFSARLLVNPRWLVSLSTTSLNIFLLFWHEQADRRKKLTTCTINDCMHENYLHATISLYNVASQLKRFELKVS